MRSFFAGYFNQDWRCDADSPDGIVRIYLQESSAREIRDLVEEMERYLSDHPDDGELGRLLFDDLGCYYDPTAHGITVRQWMMHVAKLLRQEADHR